MSERNRSFVPRIESLEDRFMPAVDPRVGFLVESANLSSVSRNASDLGKPIVALYTGEQAGGTYGTINDRFDVSLDTNDPDRGGSLRMFWDGTGPNGYFQFGIGSDVADRPRATADFGQARTLRFLARSDAEGQQLQVNIYREGSSDKLAARGITLTTKWVDYQVALPDGTRPTDVRAVQFLVDVPRDTRGTTVRLDEVRIDTDRFDPLRLIQSYRPRAWAPTGSPLDKAAGRDLAIYSNRSFLYDNALAIKALLASGDPGAQATALDITRAIMATAPNGRAGYANVRESGHILLGNGAAQEPLAATRTLGDNAWFGLALLDAHRATGEATFLTAARDISDWAEAKLLAGGTLGGYKGGVDASGNLLPWRSTEHNMDLFQLNNSLAVVLRGLNDPKAVQAAQTYANRAKVAGNFVIAMFDRTQGKFWTGTGVGDAINKDSVPLDTQLWPLLTLARSSDFAKRIDDWSRPLRWAEANLTAKDGLVSGFTFSSRTTPGRVWFEGVAQGAVVYALRGDTVKQQAALKTLDAATTKGGVLAASHDSLTDSVLGAGYDARLGVGPTAWAYFAALGRNPYELLPAAPARGVLSSAGTSEAVPEGAVGLSTPIGKSASSGAAANAPGQSAFALLMRDLVAGETSNDPARATVLLAPLGARSGASATVWDEVVRRDEPVATISGTVSRAAVVDGLFSAEVVDQLFSVGLENTIDPLGRTGIR